MTRLTRGHITISPLGGPGQPGEKHPGRDGDPWSVWLLCVAVAAMMGTVCPRIVSASALCVSNQGAHRLCVSMLSVRLPRAAASGA